MLPWARRRWGLWRCFVVRTQPAPCQATDLKATEAATKRGPKSPTVRVRGTERGQYPLDNLHMQLRSENGRRCDFREKSPRLIPRWVCSHRTAHYARGMPDCLGGVPPTLCGREQSAPEQGERVITSGVRRARPSRPWRHRHRADRASRGEAILPGPWQSSGEGSWLVAGW